MTFSNDQWQEAIVYNANNPPGGGTQYTDGQAPPANPIGPTLVWDNGGTWLHVSAAHPLPISGSISATNPSVSTTGTAIPASATLIGASDGTNLQPLLVDANKYLKVNVVTGTVNTLHGSAVDATNSSTTLLTANSVYTGAWQSSLSYSALSVEVYTDQGSATNGLSIQQSQDGVNADTKDSFSISASTAFQTTVNLTGKYYRVVYTNGGINQGTFRLQTVAQTQDVVLPRALTSLGNLKIAIQEDNTAGLATSANQSTANTSLSSIATNTGNIPAKGQATMANSTPVTMASNQGAVPVGPSAGTAFDTNQGTTGANTLRVVSAGAATGTKSNVVGSISSVTILASNTARKGAMVYNDSTAILYLDLSGGTASSSSYSVQVPANGLFELPGPVVYNGAITGIWASATGNARVTEFS